ncbi:MAG: hypothetical protein U1E45_14925 [Geminicoccaceae bacterium]
MKHKYPAEAILRQLPPLLREVADIAGVDSALAIASVFGGRTLRVPINAGPKTDIALRCGLPAAKALVELRGGERIYVARAVMALGLVGQPQARGPFWKDGKLDQVVAEMEAEGWTRNEIARAVGVSRRCVIKAARRAAAAMVHPAA